MRPQHRLDVGAAVPVGRGHRGHDRGAGVVADEAHAHLVRDPAGGGRVPGEVAQQALGGRAAVAAGVGVLPAHHLEPADVVVVAVVRRLPGVAAVDVVAGQHERRVLHVGLVVGRDVRVGVAAHRVQLEQLAAEVLVQPPGGRDRQVEVAAHGRAQVDVDQHVLEVAQRVLAQHGVVRDAVGPGRTGGRGDVQVVGPEGDHGLVQLALAVDAAQQRPAAEVHHQVERVQGVVGRGLDHRRHRHLHPREPAAHPAGEAVGDLVGAQLLLEPGRGATRRPGLGHQRRRHSPAEARQQVPLSRGGERWCGHWQGLGFTL